MMNGGYLKRYGGLKRYDNGGLPTAPSITSDTVLDGSYQMINEPYSDYYDPKIPIGDVMTLQMSPFQGTYLEKKGKGYVSKDATFAFTSGINVTNDKYALNNEPPMTVSNNDTTPVNHIPPITTLDIGRQNSQYGLGFNPLTASMETIANEQPAASYTKEEEAYDYAKKLFPDYDYFGKGAYDVDRVRKTLQGTTGEIEEEIDDAKRNNKLSEAMKHYLAPFIAGKGIEMLGKGIILATGYDKEKPVYNPYADKVRKLMAERSIDFTALMNQNNLQRNYAMEQSRDSARSVNVMRALNQGIYNTAAQKATELKLAERQANMGYRGEEANTLFQLGEYDRKAKELANDLTARNKGQWLTNVGTYLGDIGRAGEFGTKVRLNDMQIKEGFALMKHRYEDFGIDEESYKRLTSGKYTNEDLIKFKDALTHLNTLYTNVSNGK